MNRCNSHWLMWVGSLENNLIAAHQMNVDAETWCGFIISGLISYCAALSLKRELTLLRKISKSSPTSRTGSLEAACSSEGNSSWLGLPTYEYQHPFSHWYFWATYPVNEATKKHEYTKPETKLRVKSWTIAADVTQAKIGNDGDNSCRICCTLLLEWIICDHCNSESRDQCEHANKQSRTLEHIHIFEFKRWDSWLKCEEESCYQNSTGTTWPKPVCSRSQSCHDLEQQAPQQQEHGPVITRWFVSFIK